MRTHPLTRLVICLLALVLIVALGYLARGSPLDVYLLRWTNLGYVSPVLDALATLGYVLGSVWFGLLLAAGLFTLGQRRIGVSLAVATLANSLLVLGLKLLFDLPRPWQILGGVRVAGEPPVGEGYFSGHAAQAFLMAHLLSRYFSLRWYLQALLYLLAVLVCWSRVYDGEHFPVDVIVGMVEGLLAGYVWLRLWPWLVEKAQAQRGP
ncbi:MAG: phosphatase PAP2 family protein [Anaerolineae bacterium]